MIGNQAVAQSVGRGQIDLSVHNFENGGLSLSGNWEFYWNKLLSPQDFKFIQNPEWVDVPGSWHRQGNYPLLGCATYRVSIKLDKTQNGLALYFPIINSAAKIWVNGELVSETGVVNTNPKIYSPQLMGTLVPLPEKTPQLDIIVQVANYTYFSGGIAGYPRLDKSSALFERLNRINGIENFFAGCLIALFIYQLILYLLFHRGKPYLWLALICLGVALRALIVHGGSFLLPNLFPSMPWEFWKKIEFGSVYAITALFPLYVYHLFSEQAPKKPIWIFAGVAALLCGAVLITPQYMYGKLLDISHIMLLLAFIYAVYSIGKAWRAGSADARIILFGVLASFPFILAEILKNTQFFPLDIEFMYLVELGVLIFLLFQVYLLASHYAKSYQNLERLNQNLEKIVDERTRELVTANTVSDRLLSVVGHDIKSPLNSLHGILKLYNAGSISREEFNHFSKQLEADLSKTSGLIDNILYWTAIQLKGIQAQLEKFDVMSLIDENIHLFKTIAANKKIEIHHNLLQKLIIRSDKNILNLVLRNLLSNAIKFSHEGGEIVITASRHEKSFTLAIKDRGLGMDNDTVQKLMCPKTTVSKEGTIHEKGTGLGLALCREYLQHIGGVLTIESLEEKGSTFSIELPV